jgi:hypothetical protein
MGGVEYSARSTPCVAGLRESTVHSHVACERPMQSASKRGNERTKSPKVDNHIRLCIMAISFTDGLIC